MPRSETLRVAVLFVLVFAALYFASFFLSGIGLKKWLPIDSPFGLFDCGFLTFDNNKVCSFARLDYSLWLLPIPGFFFVYMLIPWAKKELGFGKFFEYIFPVLFLAACYAAFYVAVYYYFQNNAFLNNVDISAFNAPFLNFFSADYFTYFAGSTFVYFVLAGLGGWGSRFLIEHLSEKQEAG